MQALRHIWSHAVDGWVRLPLVVTGDRLIGASSDTLHSLAVESGRPLWSRPLKRPISKFTSTGELVVAAIASRNDGGIRLASTYFDGRPAWTHNAPELGAASGLVANDGRVFLLGLDVKKKRTVLHELESLSGKLVHEHILDSRGMAMTAIDQKLLITSRMVNANVPGAYLYDVAGRATQRLLDAPVMNTHITSNSVLFVIDTGSEVASLSLRRRSDWTEQWSGDGSFACGIDAELLVTYSIEKPWRAQATYLSSGRAAWSDVSVPAEPARVLWFQDVIGLGHFEGIQLCGRSDGRDLGAIPGASTAVEVDNAIFAGGDDFIGRYQYD